MQVFWWHAQETRHWQNIRHNSQWCTDHWLGWMDRSSCWGIQVPWWTMDILRCLSVEDTVQDGKRLLIGLLECRLMPLVLDEVALSSVVAVAMARSSNGDGMDEASVYRSIEATPSSTARPGRVIWHSFTTWLKCCCIMIHEYLGEP